MMCGMGQRMSLQRVVKVVRGIGGLCIDCQPTHPKSMPSPLRYTQGVTTWEIFDTMRRLEEEDDDSDGAPGETAEKTGEEGEEVRTGLSG